MYTGILDTELTEKALKEYINNLGFMTLKTSQDFPAGPVVKILHFHCRGHAESILIKLLLTNKKKHVFA